MRAHLQLFCSFLNKSPKPIEAVYQFPVDPAAAVVGFVAEIDGKRIVAQCMEKKKAQATYDVGFGGFSSCSLSLL